MKKIIDMKRLIFVGEYFYPANNAPGARFKPLIDELKDFFNVTIYTSKISKNIKEYNISTNSASFPSNQKSNSYRLFLEIVYSIETFFRLVFSRGDIYYLTSPSFINCLSGVSYCILFRKKFVIDIRDDYPRVYFDAKIINPKGIVGRLLTWFEHQIYLNAYLIIAATEGLKVNIEKIVTTNVYLLRNGYSEKMFKPSKEKYENFTLVFHGNLSKFQDIDLIINLAKEIINQKLNIKILVVGQGYQAHKLQSKSLPASIEYLGAQPYEEIAKIIQKAHLGLSFRVAGKISEDSFPVRTYEYIGVGLPVLVTPVSEAGEYVQANKLGYQFNSDSINFILEKIIQLKNDTVLYNNLVSNVLEKRKAFSREAMSREFSTYLNKIEPS